MVTNKCNRVWIELSKPLGKEHANKQCDLANKMLFRLGDTNGMRFFYSEHGRCYCYGGDMGYKYLVDNGEWFNLDYFGRD